MCICGFSFGQMIKDPTHWTYEVKKLGNDQYQLIYHLEIEAPWHIWSLTMGANDMCILPDFKYIASKNMKMLGAVKEVGEVQTMTMEGFDKPLKDLSGKIDYIQKVSFKGKGTIKGKHGYQVCDDSKCLPPMDKEFVFVIK
jgi:thiol:disulfide interchange protein DsbD